MAAESKSFGIDLGTTRSVIACLDEYGRPRTLLNREGELTTPTAVLFDEGGIIVGREALRALSDCPERVAIYAKREMGSPQFSFDVDGVSYPPELIQSFVLAKLRADAQRSLGYEVHAAVVTVPAFFNEPRRRATIDAGLLAGLEVKAIINEPTAAALAFGASKGMLDAEGGFGEPQTMLVYDLGGGTFDVSILRIEGKSVQVLAIEGNARLGGIDWDRCVADWLGDQFKIAHHMDDEELLALRPLLMREAEDLKHSLSARKQAKPSLRLDGRRLQSAITREDFNDLTAHLLDRTRFTVRKALTEARLQWKNIDRLLLVGGSTRMPQVQKMLETESGVTVERAASPDEAVAHGAAVYAGFSLDSPPEQVSVRDVNAHNLGVVGFETETGRSIRYVMIPKNSPLPARRASRFQTMREGQRSVLVRVVEGGDARGKHATLIGKFVIYDLPRGLPAGSPVDVDFRYDRYGIIEVEARVPAAGRKASIRIERTSGISDSDRQRWRETLKHLEDLELD